MEILDGDDVIRLVGGRIPAAIKRHIRGQFFIRAVVPMTRIFEYDKDVRQFVHSSPELKGRQMTPDKPLIIGEWFGKKHQVMDGYHRLARAFNAFQVQIPAFVAVDKEII